MPEHPNPLSDLIDWFGKEPGADRTLIDWESMQGWFADLERRSPRLRVESIGQTPGGSGLELLILSNEATIRDLDSVRRQRTALEKIDLLGDATQTGHSAGEKPVVLITAGIHATEVGGVQLMPELVRDLALSDDPRVTGWMDQLIILIVPTLNPDGMIGVHAWYERTLDTPAEGTNPPWLYHPYAGHDNNRDWYTHALEETRLVVDHVHRPWRPHVVVDLHQMGQHAPRYVVPPYVDPVEPNVHPLINSLSSDVGTAIVGAHLREGHEGVSSGVLFDCYSPTRAYQHYHGGVRILAEAASAKIATPADINPDDVKPRRGFDPNIPSVHNPIPWPGGPWRLRDIMDYHRTTIDAVLDHATLHSDRWVRDQWTMLAGEVRRPDPATWVVRPLRHQVDPAATVELLRIMERGDIRIDVATDARDGVSKDSFVIRSTQPFGSYARALLDPVPYPRPRPGKDGEQPANPYDVTSHWLPLHMGVDIQRHDGTMELACRPVTDADFFAFEPPSAGDVDRRRWLAIDPRSHQSILVVLAALRNGSTVRRLLKTHIDGQRLLSPRTWLICDDHVFAAMSDAHRLNVRTWLVQPVEAGCADVSLPRIALHLPSRTDAIDAGWLRLALEQLGFPFTMVSDTDIRTGILADFDTLLVAHMKPKDLLEGNSKETYPPEFAGGLGDDGIHHIARFIDGGGHVIAIDGAARALAGALRLPIGFPLDTLSRDQFYCPGAVVRITPDPANRHTLGMDDAIPAMFAESTAFGVRPSLRPYLAATYAGENPLLSGWIHGEEHLQGLGAIIELPIGAGAFTGFGFRPHFRTQMLASMPLLTNAIMRGHDSHKDDLNYRD